MDSTFWQWLNRYPSQDSYKKLQLLKDKYLAHDNQIKYLHITGTNGKGSVARYLHNILTQGLNLKVALFTSPHISVINERIMVNDGMISDADLLRLKAMISNDVDQYQLGFFAILTLIALIYFQEQKVQWAIIEVGIGGLYDTTNIIKSDYCVITSVANDHSQLLGHTLSAILHQKLGIVKATTAICFVSGHLNGNLKAIVKQTIKAPTQVIFSPKIIQQTYYEQNQMLVTTIMQFLFPTLPVAAVAELMARTRIALRFERFVINQHTLYFDVAHNLAGIKALITMLKKHKVTVDKIIFSALHDKNPPQLLKILSQKVTPNIIVCRNQHPSSINGLPFDFDQMIKNERENSVILITGSCYFAADVYNQLLSVINEGAK